MPMDIWRWLRSSTWLALEFTTNILATDFDWVLGAIGRCTQHRRFDLSIASSACRSLLASGAVLASHPMASCKPRPSIGIKHGRICMGATMGYSTLDIIGMLSDYWSRSAGLKFADIHNALVSVPKVPTLGWAHIATYFGFCEFSPT